MYLFQLIKHAMNYGTIAGLLSFMLFIILYAIVKNPLGEVSYIGFWIPVLFIILAVRSYKNNYGEGHITYGKAFRTGAYTGFFMAFLFSIMFYLFMKIYDPSILERHKTYLTEQLEFRKELWSESFYQLSLESIDKTTIGSLAWNEFSIKFIGAFITSLIVAAFFKSPRVNLNK